MIFVVTPLNLLGKQNVDSLCQAGLRAIAVSSENANATVYKVSIYCFCRIDLEHLPCGNWQDIEDGNYNVVVINPELLMGNEVTVLLMKPKVKKRILYFTFDEGHCISQWGKFRKEYLLMGDLRYLISEDIPFYIASATLPPAVLLDVIDILRLRPGKTEKILRSNDRPDIHLMAVDGDDDELLRLSHIKKK
jgi:superfamily II DNA helicase RecQ